MDGIAAEEAAADQAIEVLNRIHTADPTVLPALIGFRVPCNMAVADDPTVQVGPDRPPADQSQMVVGLLGVINGLFGTVHGGAWGYIGAVYDDDGELTHFQRTKAA